MASRRLEQTIADLVTKLHGLSVRDTAYAVLYAQCKHRFPQVAQDLVGPDLFQATSTVAYHAPASQPAVDPIRHFARPHACYWHDGQLFVSQAT
jgi:hypothetical protein